MATPNTPSEISNSKIDLHFKLTEISLFMRRRLMDHFDSTKLSLNQYRVLRILRQTPDLSLSSLEEIIIMKKGNLSRIVDTLVRQNLINRRRDNSSDRRKISLSLTQKGTKLLVETDQNQNELISKLYQSIPEEKVKEFDRILKDLQQYLQGSSD